MMGIENALWRAKAGIAALIFLGIAELLVVDVSAASLKISLIGGAIFAIASPIIFFLSAAAVGWEAAKHMHEGGKGVLAGAKIGALVAFAASLALDAIMFAMSLLGRGVAKLFPAQDAGTAPLLAHALLLVVVPLAYTALGAVAGASAAYIAKKMKKE